MRLKKKRVRPINKVRKTLYYVVDFSNLLEPKIHKPGFDNKKTAYMAIHRDLSGQFDVYRVLSGRDVIQYRKLIKNSAPKHLKYDYPDWVKTNSQRKDYRTTLRRFLRGERKNPKKKYENLETLKLFINKHDLNKYTYYEDKEIQNKILPRRGSR